MKPTSPHSVGVPPPCILLHAGSSPGLFFRREKSQGKLETPPRGAAKAGRNHCLSSRGRSPSLALCTDSAPETGSACGTSISGLSPSVHGVARDCRSRVGARPVPGGGGPCRGCCGSPLELLAAGKMLGRSLLTWVLLATAVTCAQAQQVPPVGELQPSRGAIRGAGVVGVGWVEAAVAGRSGAKRHLRVGCIFRGACSLIPLTVGANPPCEPQAKSLWCCLDRVHILGKF